MPFSGPPTKPPNWAAMAKQPNNASTHTGGRIVSDTVDFCFLRFHALLVAFKHQRSSHHLIHVEPWSKHSISPRESESHTFDARHVKLFGVFHQRVPPRRLALRFQHLTSAEQTYNRQSNGCPLTWPNLNCSLSTSRIDAGAHCCRWISRRQATPLVKCGKTSEP